MIRYLSPRVSMKAKRRHNEISEILQSIRSLSGHDYRLYYTEEFVLCLDVTCNKILWIVDYTFSMAVVIARLSLIRNYWNYEKISDKRNIQDYFDFLKVRQTFKSYYYD